MDRNFLSEAEKIKDLIVEYRRQIHSIAETGVDLPKTTKYIEETLAQIGIDSVMMGGGIVGRVGRAGGNVLLLRADCDALPMCEETGLSFCAGNGNMHACGHDMHAAMLLGAARLLKSYEQELCGEVMLVFQPGEEILMGARRMIEDGLLSGVKPCAAVMIHVVTSRELPVGSAVVPVSGVVAPGVNYFKITVNGVGAHGAMPSNGRDPITLLSRIILGLEEVTSREYTGGQVTLTVGKISGGSAPNAIAKSATLEGTVRAYDPDVQEEVKDRIIEISEGLSDAFLSKCNVEFTNSAPELSVDGGVSLAVSDIISSLLGKENVKSPEAFMGAGSEDFAYIAKEVPSAMVALSAGENEYTLHHPKVRFDESVLPIGAAIYGYVALRLLSDDIDFC